MRNEIRPFDGMTGELVQNATLDALRMAQMNFAREEYDRLERLILHSVVGRLPPLRIFAAIWSRFGPSAATSAGSIAPSVLRTSPRRFGNEVLCRACCGRDVLLRTG